MTEVILDANVLLRYLTDEPKALADQVAEIIEHAYELGIALVVTPLTLAEIVYVLESVYRWERQVIANHLLDLMSAAVFQMLEPDVVAQSLRWYRDVTALHFADAYVAATAAARGHNRVVSFDRGLRRLSSIELIETAEHLSTTP